MMNPIKKKAIRIEFETTNLTIQQICEKYNITEEDLGRIDNWEKRAPQEADTDNILVQEETKTEVIAKENLPAVLTDDGYDMIDEIYQTKKEALVATKKFFTEVDFDEISTKEFKDMTGVLKDLEAGELAKKGQGNKGPTINIAIQNIMERFQDDC